jgi:exodeoxyribonuclease VII small subunit
MTETKPESMDFETAFNALQEIIAKLESAELPLEEALRLYEEGKRLAALCTSILENAQLRVSTLGEESPNETAFDFSES